VRQLLGTGLPTTRPGGRNGAAKPIQSGIRVRLESLLAVDASGGTASFPSQAAQKYIGILLRPATCSVKGLTAYSSSRRKCRISLEMERLLPLSSTRWLCTSSSCWTHAGTGPYPAGGQRGGQQASATTARSSSSRPCGTPPFISEWPALRFLILPVVAGDIVSLVCSALLSTAPLYSAGKRGVVSVQDPNVCDAAVSAGSPS
jgi:hypothetical protein